MIERLNQINIRIQEITEEYNYNPKELLDLMWEREEIMIELEKLENN